MTALLAAERLELAYGEAVVCRDLSFEVAEGEIVALIGANGAGKSTTLRAVAGALIPRSGSIRFRGSDLTRLPAWARTNLGIALVPEGRHVFPFLTVRENLELGGFKHRRDAAKVRSLIEKVFAMFPRLARARSAERRHAVRRRAADAGARPRHDVGAAVCCASTSRRSASRP